MSKRVIVFKAVAELVMAIPALLIWLYIYETSSSLLTTLFFGCIIFGALLISTITLWHVIPNSGPLFVSGEKEEDE